MKQRRASANRGFSLIELVIVITIMAILTALLAPQLLRYVENSRVARDEQNIDEIYRAIMLSLNDEKAYDAVLKYCESHPGGYWLHVRNSTEVKVRGMVVQGTMENKSTVSVLNDVYTAIRDTIQGTHIESQAVIFPHKYRFSSRKYIGLISNSKPALTIVMTLVDGELITRRIAAP